MTASRTRSRESLPPDQIKLGAMQTERLSAMSAVAADELAGLSVAEISDRFRFRVDPMLLFFRKVCGQVVKKDPVSGVEYPVPYATVHVEDTDCSLLGYFPAGSRWAWYFPFFCRRETIATARTDECGNFCVWIPRWDIDWLLRFRHERICYPIVFERPSLRDLLEELVPERIPFPFPEPDPPPFGPRPGPDPAPFARADRGLLIEQLQQQYGRALADTYAGLDAQLTFGASNVEMARALDSAAFEQPLPPPLPRQFRMPEQTALRGKRAAAADTNMDTARASLAAQLRLEEKELAGLDLRRYIGPFKRCFDVLIPEWTPLIDIPDISFRVTQDVDADGDEETIYAENYFQVRWNAGAIAPLKLMALPNALSGLPCGGDPVPCGNVPAIVLAGRMPVTNAPTIYDAGNGYALRPNRPHPSGLFVDPLPNPDAASPFHGAVTLFGCNQTDTRATQYRIVYKYSADGGATFTEYVPFLGLSWPLFRLDAGGMLEIHYPVPDSQGWYPIALPSGSNPFLPQDILLDWPTRAKADGRYVLKVELGSGGKETSSSAEVAFTIDNAAPKGPFTIEWRKEGSGSFQLLRPPCPLIKRGSASAHLEFRVTLAASATHLRSAYLDAEGCGGGDFTLVSGTTQHWHEMPADNAETLQAIYRLDESTLQGTYSFSAVVSSRAFNPNGGDGGHLKPIPWQYDPDDLHIHPRFAFSVINAD